MTTATGSIGQTPKSELWRVVIIEDSPDDRAEIRRMLLNGSERRYKFVEAETGAEGLRAILDPTAGPPDCVVLDYALPDTDAVEVLAALVGPDGLTICPVVVLTGIAGHERTRTVLRAGAQDYLGKGWMTAESLTRAVENAAERFAMTRELSARATSLRMSEERFRLAARVAGLAVAEIDYATGQVHLSPESAALFGLPLDPPVVSRATIHALFHPDDRPELDKLMAASYDPTGTGEFAMDHRIIWPDGHVRWHSVRKQVFFEQARPARALLAMFDITERKQAEAVTQQNAFLFAKIIEQAPGGVYVMDAQLRVREVNAEALPIFANVQPLIGRELGEVLEILWGPEIGRHCTDIFRHTLKTGERYVSPRFDHLRQDIGEEQAYEWQTQRITLPDGQHGVVCYFQNVTQRQRWEAALRTKEQELRSVTDNTPDILTRFDRDLRHLFVNAAVNRATGRRPDEIIGKTNRELDMPAEHCDQWEAGLRSVFDAGEPKSLEFTFITPTGTRHYAARLVPEFGPDGAVESVLVVTQDVTDRRQMEKALQDVDRRKDEFLATLAHELRNPLAATRSAVKFLQIKSQADPEWQWASGIIDRQTQSMTRLIDDLMDVNRINQGKIDLQLEHVELSKIVQDAVETSRPLIDELGHQLTVTLPPGTVMVNADVTRLAQIFMNLLNNSAKYTEPGGTIHLRGELQGSDVLVSVKDTGIGIPPDKLAGIFEMFSQVQGALSRSQGGLGIGLSLVKRLVEMHGGTVEARSDGPGKGSEFVIRLPIVVPKTHAEFAETNSAQVVSATTRGPRSGTTYARTASDDRAKPATTSDLRILVVDDHLDSAQMLSMFLKMTGNTVQTAHDGEQAVTAAREFRPHVVLCDIGLPKLNGYEACRLMKQQAWDRTMVLIALTGWGQDEDREKSALAGFDHHLVKPVDLNSLTALLAGLQTVRS